MESSVLLFCLLIIIGRTAHRVESRHEEKVSCAVHAKRFVQFAENRGAKNIRISSARHYRTLRTRAFAQGHEVSLCSRSLRPSTSLRAAQGERGKGENRRNLPFMLSVAA
jgi:hypothetical protein